MAIDTRGERYRAMTTEEQICPLPDGSIQKDDRAQLLGIFAQESAAGGNNSNSQSMQLRIALSIS